MAFIRRLQRRIGGPPARASASASQSSEALALLSGETEGLAFCFTDSANAAGSVAVIDTGTPANDVDGDPQDSLTYTSPSEKWVFNDSGVLVSTDDGGGGYNLPIQHDQSTNEKLGLLIEEQRTNLVLQSNDFTNAAWSKTTMTTAKDQTGPDNVSNSASLLTATAANATAIQSITSTSADRTFSVWLKRVTGTGNIEITLDNGSTWTAVTGDINGSTWSRVDIQQTLADPDVGIRIVTSGDEVAAWCAQQEEGSFPTSPIPTTTVAVTRVADDISMPSTDFPWNADEGYFRVSASEMHVDDSAPVTGIAYFSENSISYWGIRMDDGGSRDGQGGASHRNSAGGSPSRNTAITGTDEFTPLQWNDLNIASSYDIVTGDLLGSYAGSTSFATPSTGIIAGPSAPDLGMGKFSSGIINDAVIIKEFKYVPELKTQTYMNAETA